MNTELEQFNHALHNVCFHENFKAGIERKIEQTKSDKVTEVLNRFCEVNNIHEGSKQMLINHVKGILK